MGMNMTEMFSALDSVESEPTTLGPELNYTAGYQPPTTPSGAPIDDWSETFAGFKTRPMLYNIDGYISPYSSNNWGGTSSILQYIDDDSRLPGFEQKIDPNRIFTAETNALRTQAADQQRIVKLFEKRLVESLNEKGKVGLTEEDIEAMSALTSARSAITAINKEQINIRKNIADLKIKIQQNKAAASGAAVTTTGGSMKGAGAMEIGRSILDNVFDVPGIQYSTSQNYQQQVASSYAETDVNKASAVLDALVPSNANSAVAFESAEPTTYVVVGDSDDDVDFVTYGADGNVIPDYPVPDAKIDKIDREAKTAVDQYLVQYPIKFKD